MKRIFVDSSVLFSAANSSKGHARDLVNRAIRGEVVLVVSTTVLEETRRNLAEYKSELVFVLNYIVRRIPFEVVEARKRQVITAARYVALKDAPIVAAARKAKVDYLVTLDKKHLLGRPGLAEYIRAEIVTPKEAVIHLTRLN